MRSVHITPILLALIQATVATAQPLTATDIVQHMVRADNERMAAFTGYTSIRHYSFENTKVNKHAEMKVRVACDRIGTKNFEIISESGSGFIRNHILRRMIDAEHEASERGEREQTRIVPENYDFRLLDTEVIEGRQSYVLEISPKTNNKFLVRGRIWVDAQDFAIMRVEGSPAKNPSFWIRSVHIMQRYDRIGNFWLPVINESRAEARIFGATEVGINYSDYLLGSGQDKADSNRGIDGSDTARAALPSALERRP